MAESLTNTPILSNDIIPPKRLVMIPYLKCDFCGECQACGGTRLHRTEIDYLVGWQVCSCLPCNEKLKATLKTFLLYKEDILRMYPHPKTLRSNGIEEFDWTILGGIFSTTDNDYILTLTKIPSEEGITPRCLSKRVSWTIFKAWQNGETLG